MSNIHATKQVFESKSSSEQPQEGAGSAVPKKTGGSFVVKAERCDVCGKSVYFSDKLSADGKIFHKACFRCAECGSALKLGTYAALEGKFYCKPHFKQLFALKGNYAEGFGEKKPDQLWREGKGIARSDEKPQAPEEPTSSTIQAFKRDGQSTETEKKWQEKLEQQRIEREKQDVAEREERARAVEAMKRNRELVQQQVQTAPSSHEWEIKIKQLEAKLSEALAKEQRTREVGKENEGLKLRVRQLEEELEKSKSVSRVAPVVPSGGGDRERIEKERLEKRIKELESKGKNAEEQVREIDGLQFKVKHLEKTLSDERGEKKKLVESEQRLRRELEFKIKRLEAELEERRKQEQDREKDREKEAVGSRVRNWESKASSGGSGASTEKKELESQVRSLEERLRKKEAEVQDLRLVKPKTTTSGNSTVMVIAKVVVCTLVAFVVGFYAGRMVTPW